MKRLITLLVVLSVATALDAERTRPVSRPPLPDWNQPNVISEPPLVAKRPDREFSVAVDDESETAIVVSLREGLVRERSRLVATTFDLRTSPMERAILVGPIVDNGSTSAIIRGDSCWIVLVGNRLVVFDDAGGVEDRGVIFEEEFAERSMLVRHKGSIVAISAINRDAFNIVMLDERGRYLGGFTQAADLEELINVVSDDEKLWIVGIDSCPGRCEHHLALGSVDVGRQTAAFSVTSLEYDSLLEAPTTALILSDGNLLFARLRDVDPPTRRIIEVFRLEEGVVDPVTTASRIIEGAELLLFNDGIQFLYVAIDGSVVQFPLSPEGHLGADKALTGPFDSDWAIPIRIAAANRHLFAVGHREGRHLDLLTDVTRSVSVFEAAANQTSAQVTPVGDGLLVSWEEESPYPDRTGRIKTRFISSAGATPRPGPTRTLGPGWNPVVCSSTEGALVAWDLPGPDVGVAIVDFDGTIEVRPPIPSDKSFASCSFDGQFWELVALDDDASALRLDPDGHRVGEISIGRSDWSFPNRFEIVTKGSEDGSIVVWLETARQCGKGCWLNNVRSALVVNGTPTPSTWVSSSDRQQWSPTAVQDSEGWVVGWLEADEYPAYSVRIRRLSPSGIPIGEPIHVPLHGTPELVSSDDALVVISDEQGLRFVVLDGSTLEIVKEGSLVESRDVAQPRATIDHDQLWLIWQQQLWPAPWAGGTVLFGQSFALDELDDD